LRLKGRVLAAEVNSSPPTNWREGVTLQVQPMDPCDDPIAWWMRQLPPAVTENRPVGVDGGTMLNMDILEFSSTFNWGMEDLDDVCRTSGKSTDTLLTFCVYPWLEGCNDFFFCFPSWY